MKTYRRALTDINGRDMMTGEVVVDQFDKDLVAEQTVKAQEMMAQKKAEAVDGKIYIAGLGWVNA